MVASHFSSTFGGKGSVPIAGILTIDLKRGFFNNVSFKIWSRIGNKAQKPNSEHFMYNFPNSLFQIEDILDCEAIFYCTGSGIQPGQKFTTNELYQLNLFEPIRLINGLQEKHYKGKIITNVERYVLFTAL